MEENIKSLIGSDYQPTGLRGKTMQDDDFFYPDAFEFNNVIYSEGWKQRKIL